MRESDRLVVDTGKLMPGEGDYIDPADWFVDGHPSRGTIRVDGTDASVPDDKRKSERVELSTVEKTIRRHRREDRRANPGGLSAALATVKAGRRQLPPEQFAALARFMFLDFPRKSREAIRLGKIAMGDGTSVVRGEAKAEAA